MDCLEVISKLCEAVRILSEIVDKQTEIIERDSIENAAVQDLRCLRDKADELFCSATKGNYCTLKEIGGD